MKHFDSEGTFKVKITEADFAESKFKKDREDVVDIALRVETDDGYFGVWTGELSNDYGNGTMSDLTQTEITINNLKRIGWGHGENITPATLNTLVGVETDVKVQSREWEGRVFYDVKYIGASFGPRKLDNKTAAARVSAILAGNAAAAQPVAPVQQSAAPAPSKQTEHETSEDPFLL